ncbi:hypothetical protein E4U14_003078 [Claviceps sp. LM454 group G7]|nr:hypothetical protein E4U14_003078 [Claviceps sp. LM454 group G7]
MAFVQAEMQFQPVQDDLTYLFSRNMTFNPDSRAFTPNEMPKQEPLAPVPEPAPEPVYWASQHYTPNAHTVTSSAQQTPEQEQTQHQRRSSSPPMRELCSVEDVIRSHGLDPAFLTPSQLQLFRFISEEQQLRLLQLWSISPPSTAEDIPSAAWSSSSVEQEEELAHLRHQRQPNAIMSQNVHPVQTAGGQWTQHHEAPETEPYMTSGYEELMRREYERQSNTSNSMAGFCHVGTAIRGCHYS